MEQPDFDAERNESVRRAKPQVNRLAKCKNSIQLFTKTFQCKEIMSALFLLCCILIIIGVTYLLFFATDEQPSLEMLEGHSRLQSAIQHLNNTGVDPQGQSFKYNNGKNKTSATFLGDFIG